jgi:transmembrane sensor
MPEDEDFKRIADLIVRYHSEEELNFSETQELNNWIAQSANNIELFERFSDPEYVLERLRIMDRVDKDRQWEKVMAAIEVGPPVMPVSAPRRIHIGWHRYAAAAAVVLIVSTGAWVWSRYISTSRKIAPISSTLANDIAPGGNKAILTLADGSKLVLDGVSIGTVARQGNTRIDKLDNGRLAYKAINEKPAETVYNTLTTPPAAQFQVVLPDGSRVWLNNASSLRYPTTFTGKTREVELYGEAYFEIAQNAAMPFKVRVGNNMAVDVLGTSFNIMAYEDESAVKTTLLTGAVKVSGTENHAILKPGEQAQLAASGQLKIVDDVNTEGVIAWKNGFFNFDRADLKTLMRQIARWYDIEVSYEGDLPSRAFGGKIGRNLNLSQVLELLKTYNINFKVEGRKVTVMH